MPKDDIARPDKPKDLLDLPILISAQGMVDNEISGWMGGDYKKPVSYTHLDVYKRQGIY